MVPDRDDDFPPIPADLLQALDKMFPERTPSLKMSLDEIRWKGGERHVVRFLQDQFNRQNETVTNRKVLR
jgi:hypothetical protein|nr:hypothetical protein [Neorhizobium tomejilense]